MERVQIKEIFRNQKDYVGKEISVCGWIRQIRDSKKLGFIELNDGSFFKCIQVIFEEDKISNFKDVAKLSISSSISVKGDLVETPDGKQPFEIHAKEIEILGASDLDYPIQNKRHTFEYLRTVAHLRPRTNTFMAVFRVRSLVAYAIHKFFQEQGFVYVHTPLITGSDCEGAGEMFRVTTLDLDNVPKTEQGEVDYTQDFFGKSVNLTVSGQLNGEMFATAFGNIYTFGPTFRAENSNTPRHAAEFWMIEPEMAFADLSDNMDVAEAMVKYIIKFVMENAPEEMEFFNKFIEPGLIDRLENVVNNKFERITYTKAIELLTPYKDQFKYPVEWEAGLQTEHERFITEKIYKKPVFVTDYPAGVKAFYMKQNPDGKTVAAVDLLVPGVGEIIGGSQREENYEVLINKIKEQGMNEETYKAYLDTRKYGTVVHSGFGLGFERMVMYLTGMSNIRDVIPFPRTTGSAEF
ncbi:MAG TPA: asparagine--tRNA ligase [Clostridiaceae bacterium]|jgi:asparagine--tRNA ligase|nr:asparaginyl-tRNA synthetase [Clostridium sp. CAG:452]HJJ04114.1 asparagine--tRNA ligase [Clostridiaceae bacterium]